jgi:hypothetical protein
MNLRKLLDPLGHKLDVITKLTDLPLPYIRDVLSQTFKTLPPNNKKILFSFNEDRLFRDNDNSGREAYQIMKTFCDGGGYNVYFHRSQDFMSYYRLRKYGRLIYTIDKLRFINEIPPNTEDFIYAFDTPKPEMLNRKWKKMVYVNIEKAPTYQIGNVIPIPFCMHPYTYLAKADKHIYEYRKTSRKCRIFFGGNLHKDHYDSPIFKGRYPNYLTRLEGVQAVVNSRQPVSFIDQVDKLEKLFMESSYINKAVIFRTDHTFPIKPTDWLKIVSQNDFFVCFSGTSYPMCHNVIEAMAVGTIPIIEYSDWFHPKLEHGKNAIIFKGKEDLLKKIQDVLEMSPEKILRLRKSVLEYYDTYLTEQSLVEKYEKNAQCVSTIMRFPRFVLTEKDSEEGRIFSEKWKSIIPVKEVTQRNAINSLEAVST